VSKEGAARWIIVAVVAIVVLALALVQAASDALYASAGPGSLAARIPLRFGLAVYDELDRIAPAAYVEDALAHAALRRGNLRQARHYAVRMPAESRRDEVLAEIARARGDHRLALEYYFAAPDIGAMQREIARLSKSDLGRARAMEDRFRARLVELRTHPDAVADSYWISGLLDARAHQPARALARYQTALKLAPLNMKYVLAAANQAYDMHDDTLARRLFERGRSVNPGSGDVLAGLGLLALREGHPGEARSYLARAQRADPHAQMIPALERALR
jgi:tetratricopeptide (TPR) repeat protein